MERTDDVVSEAASFRELLLPEHVVGALAQAGFLRPSPVQQAAIPLAGLGADVIVQAKAGTGKTLVFALAAVERADLASSVPQVLVLVPTREIALQASDVIGAVAAGLPPPGLACGTFIGGLPIEEDERFLRRHPCQVAVGTPGRLAALLARGALPASRIRLLVLDEADKLLGGDCFGGDVEAILGCLPERKQTLALSATYSQEMLEQLRGMMRRPREVLLCSQEVSLLGIHQLYLEVAALPATQPQATSLRVKGEPEWRQLFEARMAALLRILSSVAFHQAVVFCNWKRDAEEVAARLLAAGYPATYLSAAKGQLERIDALNALRDFRLRVAVTTDLAARGIDLDRVNLVVNLDLPQDAATYMHRVGRAGRFGTRGVAVTLICGGERAALEGYLLEEGGQVHPLPDHIPKDWYTTQQQPSSSSSGSAGNGHYTPQENGLAASKDAAAAKPEPVEDGGLAAAFLDVATASLWYDEPSEGLPSSATWPPAQGPQPRPQEAPSGVVAHAAAMPPAGPAALAASKTATATAVAAATEAVAAAEAARGACGSGVGAAEEDDGIDLSYTVVGPDPPRPGAAALGRPDAVAAAAFAAQAALSRLSVGPVQPQRPAGASLSAAAPAATAQDARAAPSSAAAGAAADVESSESDVDEDDSWASSSDDVLSSSDEPGSPAIARRARSLPAAIPAPHLHGPRHPHLHHLHSLQQLHHTHRAAQHRALVLPNGTLAGYLKEVRRSASGRGSSHRATAAAAAAAAVAAEPAAGAEAGAGVGAAGPAGLPGAGGAQPAEAEAGEQQGHDLSFRDAWLSGAMAKARQANQAAAAAAAGGPCLASAASPVELRPHSPAGPPPRVPDPAAPATTAAAPAAALAAEEVEMPPPPPAPPAAPAGSAAEPSGYEGRSSGGSSVALSAAGPQAPAGPAAPQPSSGHYWLLVESARADLAAGGAAAEGGPNGGELAPDAARLLEEAFSPLAAAAAGSGGTGWVGQQAEEGGESHPGLGPSVQVAPAVAAAAIAAAAAEGEDGGQFPTSKQGQPGRVPAEPPAAGGRQRRPLGSVQADTVRQHAQRAEQEGGSSEGDGGGGRGGGGGGRWGSLAAEAAILEAWAEGGSEEEEEEGEEGGGPGGGERAEAGPSEEAANEEAWRQYYLQYYEYYGCYPSHFGPAPASGQAAHPSVALAATAGGRTSGTWGAQPLPPPPPPPMQQLAAPAAPATGGAGQLGPAPVGPWVPDSEGYVRVPADVLARLQEAEWRGWQRRFSEWCWVWDRWYGSYWSTWAAQGGNSS